MTIIEAICAGNRRHKTGESLSPKGVVLHSIGTPQPNALVLRDYWQRDASPYIVHYMVDDHQILHCMPDDRKCWHVGGPGTPSAANQMYRIRRSWADAASQIGAYTNLDYAKAACKDGYAVFDASGRQVWPEAAFTPYLVRIKAHSGLNIRSIVSSRRWAMAALTRSWRRRTVGAC